MKKNQLLFIIILISLTLVVVFFQLFRHKATSKNEKFIPVLQNNFQVNYQLPTFTGAWPIFPESLPLLNLTITENPLIKERVASYCQIDSTYNSFYLGKICDYYYYNNNQNLEISNSTPTDLEALSFFTLEEAAQKAIPILSTFIPNYQALTQSSASYLAGGYEIYSTTTDKATFIQLNYNYTYQNIPLLEKNSHGDSFSILLSQALPLQKVNLLTQVLTFVPQGQPLELISLNQALKNISQGKAYLFGLGNFSMDSNDVELDFSSLKNIQLNRVALEYRYEANNSIAVPYYRFFGDGADYNNNSFSLQIFTPAIKAN